MDGGRRKSQSLTSGPRRRVEPRLNNAASLPVLSASGPAPSQVLKRRLSRSQRTHPLPRFLGTYLTFAFASIITLTGLVIGGHIEQWRKEQGSLPDTIARFSGFGIERVMMTGQGQLSEREVLQAAGISQKLSLPFLDAEAVREKLEAVPLIKSASIRKLYPDGLSITLVEREAHALWQKDGELFIISADGAVIDHLRDERFKGLPHVVGEGANERTREYLALLDHAGSLKKRILAGTLVSGRRWTFKLDNGIDLRLPEKHPEEAIRRLLELEKKEQLLSKDIIAIDLRMSDRFVVRLTEEAAQAHAETMRKRPVRGKGVDT